MYKMFTNCNKLSKLDLSSFSINNNNIDFDCMFINLDKLSIATFEININYMFTLQNINKIVMNKLNIKNKSIINSPDNNLIY